MAGADRSDPAAVEKALNHLLTKFTSLLTGRRTQQLFRDAANRGRRAHALTLGLMGPLIALDVLPPQCGRLGLRAGPCASTAAYAPAGLHQLLGHSLTCSIIDWSLKRHGETIEPRAPPRSTRGNWVRRRAPGIVTLLSPITRRCWQRCNKPTKNMQREIDALKTKFR
jgi:hypothetical protein